MGQKVHPEGFRLGVKRKGEKVDFKSSWYSDRDFAELLGEDLKIRDHIEKKLSRAGIACRPTVQSPERAQWLSRNRSGTA